MILPPSDPFSVTGMLRLLKVHKSASLWGCLCPEVQCHAGALVELVSQGGVCFEGGVSFLRSAWEKGVNHQVTENLRHQDSNSPNQTFFPTPSAQAGSASVGTVFSLRCCVVLLVTFPFECLLFRLAQGNEMQNQKDFISPVKNMSRERGRNKNMQYK